MKLFGVFLLVSAMLFSSCSSTRPIASVSGKTAITEMRRTKLGGYEQFLLIRGTDVNKPILLLLHGGPGAAATGLFRKYNGDLEDDFVVVYWDQRGAGKSYSKKLNFATVTLQQYIEDTHELVSYLRNRFKRDKIFLLGHSWGTKLGMYVIQKYPEDFYLFVSVGQEVASYEGEKQSYLFTVEKAREVGNKKALRELEAMGEPAGPDYNNMYRNGFWGVVRQKHWLLKLGGERYNRRNYLDWVGSIWLSREYTLSDMFRWVKGSATTAGQMLKDPHFASFDFRREFPTIPIPVIFISGQQDYNTPWPLVKEYYEAVEAPSKEFILMERSGHSPPFEQPNEFNKIIRNRLGAFATTRAK